VHPEVPQFVPRTLPPTKPGPMSRAARELDAKAYWDSLTAEQEAWVLGRWALITWAKSQAAIVGAAVLATVRLGLPSTAHSRPITGSLASAFA
jgi:hypothetical protein